MKDRGISIAADREPIIIQYLRTLDMKISRNLAHHHLRNTKNHKFELGASSGRFV